MTEGLGSKRLKTKAHIMNVAAQLFSDKGYAATSMDQLAKACKLTKGALYDHFNGKEDVYLQSVSNRVDTALGWVDEQAETDVSLSAQRRLFSYAESFLIVLDRDPVIRRLILRWLTDAAAFDTETLIQQRIIDSFNTLLNLIAEYRPKLNAKNYAYSFYCSAILGDDMRRFAEFLTPEVKTINTVEGLMAHFKESLS